MFQLKVRSYGINKCYIIAGKYFKHETFDQDGRSIGRYTLPLHTTKKRTTHLKTKNNHNHHNYNLKIKLYGSTTTQELKKKHSFRLEGGTEQAAGVERMNGEAPAGRPGSPTLACA